ncbi:hypothetical protein ACFYOY_37095 [Streptomyces sp. NPDC007875]
MTAIGNMIAVGTEIPARFRTLTLALALALAFTLIHSTRQQKA